MHTTKRSHFSIPWPILPSPSRAEVDCGVFEVYERADPLKWAACLHWPCLYPPPKASNFSPIFCRHIQSRLSVPHLIRRPKRYPTVDCGMVDFLTGIAGPIWAAYRDSARMCLSLDGPALPLVLPRDLLLMRCLSRLPGRRWKSGYPGCRQDGASHRNRSYCCKCCPRHVRCGQQGQQEREKRSRSNDEPRAEKGKQSR
jgi:hypothetical protein